MPIAQDVKKKYIPTIGIECHVQLKTKTKLFSAVSNDARGAAPNTLINHIDAGMPGALPVLNSSAIELSVRAAFAFNTKPEIFSKFDRKHYFYPDLPKGYQITQYEDPIIKGGYVELATEDGQKRINLTRVHIEEDAGKNIHPEGSDFSLVDLNRAGTPLLEIVSEPEITNASDAKAFARELYLLMKYANVSDVDLYHGNMRFDVNVSVSKTHDKFGKRTEIKNLNSFRSVENAVAYEINRQIEIYEKGQEVTQETRGWDDAKQKTISQRGKEEAHDYRYMPEPDIPPVVLSEEQIEDIKAQMPLLPNQIRETLNKLSIDSKVVEDLLDRSEFIPRILDILESAGKEHARRAAFDLLRDSEVLKVKADDQIITSQMVSAGEISSSAAAKLLDALKSNTDARALAQKLNLIQVSDVSEIEKVVVDVLNENQQAAQDIKNGEEKAIGFLVGQVMSKSKGKANPTIAMDVIKKHLGL